MLPKAEEMDSKDIKPTNALSSSYNDQIRPLLDAIDRLRHLKVTQEGIELPTIVVVGDQSSGKSSVLESLAGISLPRGQGICTRVPLVMRLQDSPCDEPQLQLEFKNKTVDTSESDIIDAITAATDEIAGSGKGISNTPLILVVKKKGVPDLTMVDLPGITRVPVQGQPQDIYEQISRIIMEYITQKETIILNVLSATVDFPTCESIRMSQQVDRTGERTLAVVTKADKAPEGLLEKVTADDVNIGLGYVCVRNRIGNESYEQARVEEANLFRTHPLISKIDENIVGIPVLAKKLMQIQAASITRCLPDIVKKINNRLMENQTELGQMPQNLRTVGDAMRAFMHMLSSAKETMRKVLVKGEFEDFPDDATMHGSARVAEMLGEYQKELPSSCPFDSEKFLMEEIEVLLEAKGIGLPNFLPETALLALLRRKIKVIAQTPEDFVAKVWSYVEDVATKVLVKYSKNYPQLNSRTRRATQNLMQKMRDCSYLFVKEIIEMETTAAYTSNPDYMMTCSNLMDKLTQFKANINSSRKPSIYLEGFEFVGVEHLREHMGMLEQAFDLRMRMTAYWRTVILRLVDVLALHVLKSLKNMVEHEFEKEFVNELVGSRGTGIEVMLKESPKMAAKRKQLIGSIELLEESKKVVAKIMDYIVTDCGEYARLSIV